MGTSRIDDDTVDRILSGLVDPGDAPPGYEAAVALIAAARGTPVAAWSPAARPLQATGRFRPRLPILAAALVLGGGSGAAYAAGLPAAASSTAHEVLRSLEGSAGPRTAPSGSSQVAATAGEGVTAETDAGRASAAHGHAGTQRHHSPASHTHHRHHGHGARISALAHATTGTAGAKGATISAAASDGKSHAGEHGHNGKSQASHGQGHGHGHGSHPR
jgi:hypothetical protein